MQGTCFLYNRSPAYLCEHVINMALSLWHTAAVTYHSQSKFLKTIKTLFSRLRFVHILLPKTLPPHSSKLGTDSYLLPEDFLPSSTKSSCIPPLYYYIFLHFYSSTKYLCATVCFLKVKHHVYSPLPL